MASVVRYGVCSECVSWVAVRVLLPLRTAITVLERCHPMEIRISTYGSRGQSVHRTCEHLAQSRPPPVKMTSDPSASKHRQHVLLTLCRIFLKTSCGCCSVGLVTTTGSTGAGSESGHILGLAARSLSISFFLSRSDSFSASLRLAGYRVHWRQMVWLQFSQSPVLPTWFPHW